MKISHMLSVLGTGTEDGRGESAGEVDRPRRLGTFLFLRLRGEKSKGEVEA